MDREWGASVKFHRHGPQFGWFSGGRAGLGARVCRSYFAYVPIQRSGCGWFTGSNAATYAVLNFLGVASTYDQSKISNIEAATVSKPIAGLDFDVAPPIDIIIEDQMAPDISNPPGACNHSQQVLTDALAVYSVYSQLAPNLEQAQLNKLMDAFGSTMDVSGASNSKTLESDVDALLVTVSKFQA